MGEKLHNLLHIVSLLCIVELCGDAVSFELFTGVKGLKQDDAFLACGYVLVDFSNPILL